MNNSFSFFWNIVVFKTNSDKHEELMANIERLKILNVIE